LDVSIYQEQRRPRAADGKGRWAMGRSGERGVALHGVRVSRVEDHSRPDVTGGRAPTGRRIFSGSGAAGLRP
jgi:hypothetical protein